MKLLNSMLIDMTAGNILEELTRLKMENYKLQRENEILNTKYDKLCRRYTEAALKRIQNERSEEGDMKLIDDIINYTPPSAR